MAWLSRGKFLCSCCRRREPPSRRRAQQFLALRSIHSKIVRAVRNSLSTLLREDIVTAIPAHRRGAFRRWSRRARPPRQRGNEFVPAREKRIADNHIRGQRTDDRRQMSDRVSFDIRPLPSVLCPLSCVT